MAILGASQFDNPLIAGAITSTTASMLASAGEELTKRIETQNQQFDAQMKAPQIGAHYADALTRVSQGDTSGFSEIAKASALSAGNPFLQAMFKDADNVAARLFDSYMEKEALTQKLTATEGMMDKRIAQQNETEDLRFERQQRAASERTAREEARQDEILYRQELSAWEAEKRQIDDDHRRAQAEAAKKNVGEMRRAELEKEQGRDYTPNIIEVPAPTYRPRPEMRRSRSTSGNPMLGLPEGGEVQQAGDLFGTPTSPDAAGAGPLIDNGQLSQNPLTMGEAGGTSGGGDVMDTPAPIVNDRKVGEVQGPPLPPPAEKLAETKVKEVIQKKEKGVERSIGNLLFEIPGYKETDESADVSETVNTATGSITYKKKDAEKPAKILADSMVKMESEDPAFTKWASKHIIAGNKIRVAVEKDDKGKPNYQPYAVAENGSEVPMVGVDANGQENGVRHLVSEDVYKAYSKFKEMADGPMKGKVKMRINLKPEGVEAGVRQAISNILSGKMPIEDANKQLRIIGVEPITKEEIERIKKEKADTIKEGDDLVKAFNSDPDRGKNVLNALRGMVNYRP